MGGVRGGGGGRPGEALLGAEEVAGHFGVTKTAVHRRCKEGRTPVPEDRQVLAREARGAGALPEGGPRGLTLQYANILEPPRDEARGTSLLGRTVNRDEGRGRASCSGPLIAGR